MKERDKKVVENLPVQEPQEREQDLSHEIEQRLQHIDELASPIEPEKKVTEEFEQPEIEYTAPVESPEQIQSNEHVPRPRSRMHMRSPEGRSYTPRSHQPSSYHQDERRTDMRRQQTDKPRSDTRYQRYDQQPQQPRSVDEMSLAELNMYARRLGIVGAALLRKEELLEKVKYVEAHPDLEMTVSGVLERLPDGFGFLRSSHYDYVSGPDDVYVSPSQIRRFGLRTGDMITGVIRKPKENEKYFALLKIDLVNGKNPVEMQDRLHFDRLTPKHPDEKMNLEWKPDAIASRLMDIFTPVGKGQRGLFVAPPKVGKTLLLKEISQTIVANHPNFHLIVLLVDERPEEVADMKRTLKGTSAEVISSTFDEAAERHVQVADIVLEMAKRLVEAGKDVVILLDSITRLARAYNTTAPSSGKILTGGIDANALQYPKRFFGAARATEEAGSLTILATAMVDTGSRADEVIYEEFKGTGNMEMHMTRKLSNRRTYPAFDLSISGTRREDLLHDQATLNKVWVLQKFLSTMNIIEGMEFLIDKMKKFSTNQEFLDSINKREDTNGSNGKNGKDTLKN